MNNSDWLALSKNSAWDGLDELMIQFELFVKVAGYPSVTVLRSEASFESLLGLLGGAFKSGTVSIQNPANETAAQVQISLL